MPQDNLDDMEYESIVSSAAKRFKEYEALSLREIQSLILDFNMTIASELQLLNAHMEAISDMTIVQLSDRQLEQFNMHIAKRQAERKFKNLPTTKENN